MQLSIVVPVYRSADCLPELVSRVAAAVTSRWTAFELILVNDHSPDGSWSVIERLAAQHDWIVGIDLRRNVGQDNAIMAGLREARGAKVVIMDDDLQHDPSDIPRLCAEIDRGYDVVYASFEAKQQVWWKNLGSWFADRAAVALLNKPRDLYMSPFKAIRQSVVRDVVRYDGPYTYIDGSLLTATSRFTQIPATHHPRYAGEGSCTLVRSVRVWLKLATNFSVLPLRVVSYLGGSIALLSLGIGTYFLIEALFYERTVEGWASVAVGMFFLGGIQLMGIGVLGEYVGRIFVTQNRRPQSPVRILVGARPERRRSGDDVERPAALAKGATDV